MLHLISKEIEKLKKSSQRINQIERHIFQLKLLLNQSKKN